MKKRILLLLFSFVSAVFLFTTVKAYWMDKLNFNIGGIFIFSVNIKLEDSQSVKEEKADSKSKSLSQTEIEDETLPLTASPENRHDVTGEDKEMLVKELPEKSLNKESETESTLTEENEESDKQSSNTENKKEVSDDSDERFTEPMNEAGEKRNTEVSEPMPDEKVDNDNDE